MKQSRNLVGIWVLAALLVSAAVAVAQSQSTGPAASAVQVTSAGGSLRLQVQTATTLNTGLSALCKEQKLECSGTELVARERLPQMVVEGSLQAVVKHLLEGTGINFEITRSPAGVPSKLVLLGHAPAGTTVQSGLSGSSDQALRNQPPSGYVGSAYVGSTIDQTDSVASPTTSQPTIAGDRGEASGAQSSEARAQAQHAAELMYAGGHATQVTPSEYLPFPDSNGKPIASKPPSGEFLPFPDSNGNPIPIKPAQGGSPFPTTQGASTGH